MAKEVSTLQCYGGGVGWGGDPGPPSSKRTYKGCGGILSKKLMRAPVKYDSPLQESFLMRLCYTTDCFVPMQNAALLGSP